MTAIDLPWPAADLSPRVRRPVVPWSEFDDGRLKQLHGTMTVQQIANQLGRSHGSVRGRITQLGIRKKVLWTPEEEAELRELYGTVGKDGFLNLEAFAGAMGRDPGNVSRKAAALGLQTSRTRKCVAQRKISVRPRKYKTEEDRSAARSEFMRMRHQIHGHPMLGKKHSESAREAISRASKAAQLFLTEEQKAYRTMKMVKTLRAKHGGGSIVPKLARGSWMSGWRDIGGKRNYYRSRWEANYARYLEWLKANGQIKDWQHEPETFWFENVKRGVRSYLPDFKVWENNGLVAFHEVKGWMDARSKTCIRRMAKYHPQQRLIIIDGQQYRAIRLKAMSLVPGWEDSKRDSHA